MSNTTFPPHEFGGDDFSNNSYQGNQNAYQGGQSNQQDGQSWKNRDNQQGGQGSYSRGEGGGYQGGQSNQNWKNRDNNQQGGQNRSWGSGGGQSGYQKKPWNGGQGGGGNGFQKRPEDTDMSLYKPYACTGNDDAPPEIKQKFIEIVKMLENNGYTLRTGGMEGIEEIVENSVTKKEVHLPFRDFNGKQSRFTYNSDRAYAIAKKFHPTFDGLSKGAKCFLAKNARLILGNNMTSPALFLLTWTEDGAISSRDRTARTGFAGHPIAIAAGVGIPVINLARSDAEQKLNMLITNEM